MRVKVEEGTDKKVKYLIVKTQRYGFWLRFAHEWFNPCEECQEKIDKMLFNKHTTWYIDIDLGFNAPVQLAVFGGECRFEFTWTKGFQEPNVNTLSPAIYIPCEKCQKKLEKLIKNAAELTIGNKDYIPAIELNRKWDIDDGRTQRLEEIENELKKKKKFIILLALERYLAYTKTTRQLDEWLDKFAK